MAIAGMGGYSGAGSGGMQLLRNESTSDSLAAMLGPGGLQGLEDGGQKRPFFATYDGPTVEDGPGDDGGDDGGDDLGGGGGGGGGSPLEKKRRLTFDQVRSLERNFEVENKLEPERKMQLAKELGLRPRQVAVWFQNRRARWKTKQLERDYESLAADYERLKADYEQVVGEKNHLKAEVQRLAGTTTTTTDGVTPALESAQAGETVTTTTTFHGAEFVSRCHHNAPTVDVSNLKEETSACTDGSNSSDVLDADSPRTADSPTSEHVIHSPDSSFPPESCCFMASSNMLQDMVKLEDGTSSGTAFHDVDPSCNYLLQQLDEQSVLPWWDWP